MKDLVYTKAIQLLKELIRIPSFSKEEDKTASLIEGWFKDNNINPSRIKNNVWCKNKFFDETKPTILLNSHHDTVKPNNSYSINPHIPIIKEGKLYGLGSNDAGGCLVSLMVTFLHFYEHQDLKYNLIMAATAEEEISGKNGIVCLEELLPKIDFAIIGEPTEMNLAIAEKGLLVIDVYSGGTSGHAAHENRDNAIYNAIKDIEWFNTYKFTKKSPNLGSVKMTVTQINSGTQHNVVPDQCHFVVDVRVNECYSNHEVFDIIEKQIQGKAVARSFRLNSSSISKEHPIVKAGIALGKGIYGSPTISDQALINCESIKIGPGKSTRSHSADEFIYLEYVKEGIELYKKMIKKII
jgi:acetylornithine deacetylase